MAQAKISKDEVRDDFLWVYRELGGKKALHAWASDNEKEFFKMFFTLLTKNDQPLAPGSELLEALCEIAEEENAKA